MIKDSYFLFKSKETQQVVFFLESKHEHPPFPDEMWDFLSAVYEVKGITQAEAESYEVFGIATTIEPEEIGAIMLLCDGAETVSMALLR